MWPVRVVPAAEGSLEGSVADALAWIDAMGVGAARRWMGGELLVDSERQFIRLNGVAVELTPFEWQVIGLLAIQAAHAQQIERIVNNLLSNALKYTEAGGTVWLRACCQDGQIKLSVEDTGYGIPPEDLSTIFDYFKRAPQHRDKAIGSGLGLAITKALVAEHQGVISVQSEVRKGSIFTVQLPVILPPTSYGVNEENDSE